jgi:cell division protein FtsL
MKNTMLYFNIRLSLLVFTLALIIAVLSCANLDIFLRHFRRRQLKSNYDNFACRYLLNIKRFKDRNIDPENTSAL